MTNTNRFAPQPVKDHGFTVGSVRWTFDAQWVATADNGAECAGFSEKSEAVSFVRQAAAR